MTTDRLAEIERNLRNHSIGRDYPEYIAWLIAEVKRLRSEAEDWKRGSAEESRAGDDARAELESLRIENKNLQGEVMDSDHAELVQLRAEVERLRTGLSNVQIWATQPGADPCLEVRFIREIVVETLGQKTLKRNK